MIQLLGGPLDGHSVEVAAPLPYAVQVTDGRGIFIYYRRVSRFRAGRYRSLLGGRLVYAFEGLTWRAMS